MKIRSVVLRKVANRSIARRTDRQTDRHTPGKTNLLSGGNKEQVALLSQSDRTAWWVSYGQKTETVRRTF